MNKIREIATSEITPGVLLLLTSLVSFILTNSYCCDAFHSLIHFELGFELFGVVYTNSIEHWINDGLMVIFFLFVGLEIKREILVGNLASREQLILPIVGAIGGMLFPAAIYLGLNPAGGEAVSGWAIASATDIAFALGALSLLGSRVPVSLKVFLTALAIIDDLGAILIIAVFYSSHVSIALLLAAALVVALLFILNKKGVTSLYPYLILGVPLWLIVMKSGVHATVAGVLLAMTIPLGDKAYSPLESLEHSLKSWVNFLILPVFALVSAGVDLTGIGFHILGQPITGGILFGLFLGKQFGVFTSCYIFIKLGLGKLPSNSTWSGLYGVSILTGIGFTMSLFIGALAFSEESLMIESRVGILAGSLASAIYGLVFLMFAAKKNLLKG